MSNHWKIPYISWVFTVLACSAILGISATYANVCFLPSMECFDPAAGTAPGSVPDDSCDGYNLSQPKSGWNCDECDGKYKCDSCASGYELKNGSCVPEEGGCSDGEYKYSSSQNSPWNCSQCKDESSRNKGKYRCECKGVMYNGECVEDSCSSSEYSYSSSQAATMKEKGYTCNRCIYEHSNSYGKYSCKCPSDTKEIDSTGKCVDIKNCTKNGMYNTREDCEKANNSTNKRCAKNNDCYKIECDSSKGYYNTKELCESSLSSVCTQESGCWSDSDEIPPQPTDPCNGTWLWHTTRLKWTCAECTTSNGSPCVIDGNTPGVCCNYECKQHATSCSDSDSNNSSSDDSSGSSSSDNTSSESGCRCDYSDQRSARLGCKAIGKSFEWCKSFCYDCI